MAHEVQIPEPAQVALERLAVAQGKSPSQVLAEAVSRYLAQWMTERGLKTL